MRRRLRIGGATAGGRTGRRVAAAALLVVTFLCALALAATAGAATTDVAPLAVPRKPSITAGERLYPDACAGCHGDPATFGDRAWRAGRSPADVTRMLQGGAEGHPAVVADLGSAWDATAYTWTLPDDGATIRRGERLALDAEKALRGDVLSVALLHWNDLQDLKSASWVLNHTADDVDSAMRRLAGARYSGLEPADRRALIDYVFASFFTWPRGW